MDAKRIAIITLFLILAAAAGARADTIPLSGTLVLPNQESLAYDLVVDTAFSHFVGVDGKHYTSFIATLGGTMLIYDTGTLVSTVTLADNAFARLWPSDPPQVMWDFAQYLPWCHGDPVYDCSGPPPDWALVKRFDLEAINKHKVLWVETDGPGLNSPMAALQLADPVATPEPETRFLILAGLLLLGSGLCLERGIGAAKTAAEPKISL